MEEPCLPGFWYFIKKVCFLTFKWEKTNFTICCSTGNFFEKFPGAYPWTKSFRRPCPCTQWSQIFKTTNFCTWHRKEQIQARNQLGTTGVAKSFREGPKFFKLCLIIFGYVQHIFPGGEFSKGLRFPVPPLLTGLCRPCFTCMEASNVYAQHDAAVTPLCAISEELLKQAPK